MNAQEDYRKRENPEREIQIPVDPETSQIWLDGGIEMHVTGFDDSIVHLKAVDGTRMRCTIPRSQWPPNRFVYVGKL